MKKILFLALAIGMVALSNAQVSKITAKPSGYEMTINSTEIGMALQYKYTIANIKNLLQAYNIPDSTIYGKAIPGLDSIQNWIEHLIPKVAGMHIDVIGQTHLGGPDTDLAYQKELLESQGMIKTILLSNNYSVIGSEGDPYHVITREQIINGTTIRELGDPTGQKDGQSLYLDDSYYSYGAYNQVRNAVHGLIVANVINAKVIGCEDSTFYTLQGLVIFNPAFKPLNELLTTLRSDIAFFKVAEYMLKNKLQNGAIVIGSAHLIDFVWIARSTGVVMDFYNTSQKNFFEQIAARIPKADQ